MQSNYQPAAARTADNSDAMSFLNEMREAALGVFDPTLQIEAMQKTFVAGVTRLNYTAIKSLSVFMVEIHHSPVKHEDHAFRAVRSEPSDQSLPGDTDTPAWYTMLAAAKAALHQALLRAHPSDKNPVALSAKEYEELSSVFSKQTSQWKIFRMASLRFWDKERTPTLAKFKEQYTRVESPSHVSSLANNNGSELQ